jgi:hypothetical protein
MSLRYRWQGRSDRSTDRNGETRLLARRTGGQQRRRPPPARLASFLRRLDADPFQPEPHTS